MAGQDHLETAEKKKKGTFGLSERNQYIVIAALGVFFAGLLIYRFAGDGEASAAATGNQPSQPEPERLALPPPGPPVPDEPILPESGERLLNDPFVMPEKLRKLLEQKLRDGNDEHTGQKQAGPDPEIIKQARTFALKGIIGNDTGRIAFINDRPVKAGTVINGFTVVEVREKSVLLKKEGTEVELKLDAVGGNSPPVDF